ncbi:MAG: acetylglutamate kinase [Candidatus Melainabacteria bacterium RIFOXYA12_FULL_32_12]|nr:MAG: acetylglutamate kinase [Candidatus Melainabacteria bacterium RIFOXYA2_FULL_32_9]OGI29883.1 MAG: acetylglutamate kinase [Candidatus Melainabacteria bacterium RIFOXYA12_FULL_32_12]
MKKHIEKAQIIAETLPYVKKFRDKIFVIKYGGSAMVNEKIRKTVMQDIALLKFMGIRLVVVHGGGPEINKALQDSGKEPEFINGLRVTDKETMEIVESVLFGKINKEIMQDLEKLGANAIGICGKDSNTLISTKKYINGCDLGFVGDISQVNTNLLNMLIESNFIPVVSPIGVDKQGNSYNINADYAAVAVAGALKAEKLIFLTDVPGVLRDVNDSTSLIPELSVEDVSQYIQDKTISGGMIPKVECCIAGIKQGVKSVYILDGRIEHSLLLEMFTDKGFGTMFKGNKVVTAI